MRTLARISLLAALVAAGACSKKGGSAGGGDCESEISKGVDSMMAARAKDHPDRPTTPEMDQRRTEMATKLKGAYSKRCTEDKWTADAVTCFGSVKSREDIRGCEAKLTDEQKQKVQAEAMGVMMGNRGGGNHMGGMPGHPGDLQPAGGSADGSGGGGSAMAPAPVPIPAPTPAAGSGSAH